MPTPDKAPLFSSPLDSLPCKEPQVIKVDNLNELDNGPGFCQFTYQQVIIRDAPTGTDYMVCNNTGCRKSMIRREFLSKVEHTLVKKKYWCCRLRGVLVSVSEFAKVTFYLPGV